jgi:integrase
MIVNFCVMFELNVEAGATVRSTLRMTRASSTPTSTIATLIDGGGLSARIGADHLGHTNVSMTQDKYMARGRSHIEVAELLDRAINVE